ncbi:MAG: hypothetical protein FWC42_05640 [Proteobacteria bacterium]|nr:hypothetical protein [Pseudomonadota bacterium]
MLSFAAGAASVGVDAFAQSVLLGMQLSAKHGESKGTIPDAQNACIQALTPSAFYNVVEKVMVSAFTPEEFAAINRFLSTSVGQKYLKLGLLRLYSSVGEKAPEPLPDFSDSEYRELESFAATSAGRALITRQVMQSEAARQAYNERIRELIKSCREK